MYLTEKIDIVKFIYEGVAFSAKDCLEVSEDVTTNSVICLAGAGAAQVNLGNK